MFNSLAPAGLYLQELSVAHIVDVAKHLDRCRHVRVLLNTGQICRHCLRKIQKRSWYGSYEGGRLASQHGGQVRVRQAHAAIGMLNEKPFAGAQHLMRQN